MLFNLVQTARHGILVDHTDRAVIVVLVCTREVWETLDFNVDYLPGRNREFINLFVLGQISVSIAKFGTVI